MVEFIIGLILGYWCSNNKELVIEYYKKSKNWIESKINDQEK